MDESAESKKQWNGQHMQVETEVAGDVHFGSGP